MAAGTWILIGVFFIVFFLLMRRGGFEFVDLRKKIQTDENKDRIESAIEFHGNRVRAGADKNESYQRLMKDMREIGGLDKKEESIKK